MRKFAHGFGRAQFAGVGLLLAGCSVAAAGLPAPVAEWKFEGASNAVARDTGGNRDDAILGFSKRVPGASGQALRFDGYTTQVKREAATAPVFGDAVTFEGWVALQAYPWGLCAIAMQAEEPEVKIAAHEGMIAANATNAPETPDPAAGYFFGLDSDGHVVLQLSLKGKWVGGRSDAAIPLYRWTHVAGVYDARAGGIVLYLNGGRVGAAAATGHFVPAKNQPLLLGHNARARQPEHPIRLNLPAHYGIEGYLDEVRIYGQALDAAEIREAASAVHPPADSGLRPAKLPDVAGHQRAFGAYTTRLPFTEAWDAPRRDGPDSDVVVLFDRHPWKYVFWRGTSYIPHWVTENGIWYNNEFNETWGYGALGCAEPMSDKQTRFSRVSIVQNTPARVVVHWRYALVDTRYISPHVDEQSGWGDWSDEYHIIYPDGIGVRKICLWSTHPQTPHEFQESIVLVPPGKRPEDVLETDAVTMVNMAGETHTYSWVGHAPDRIDRPAGANVEVINVRAKARPFLVVSDEPFELYGERHAGPVFRPMNVEIKRENSLFPWWNHWPVAQIPSDGRWATHADRMAHSSLTTGLEWKDWASTTNSRTRLMLHGLTELPPERLAVVARSWLRAPAIEVISGAATSHGYDQAERAYVLDQTAPAEARTLELRISAGEDRPLYHPAFIVRNWGAAPARVSLDGQDVSASKVRVGLRRTLEGDDLIVWLEVESVRPMRITFARGP